MGRRGNPTPACFKKYGLPLYCASWIPLNQIQQLLHQQSEKGEKKEEEKKESKINEQQSSSSKIQHYNYYLVLGGVGGEGQSGLSNALLLTRFDFSSASLSEEPEDEQANWRKRAVGRRGHPTSACCKNYKLPLCCTSWIPLNQIQQLLHQQLEKGEDKEEEEHKKESRSNEQ